MLRIALAAALLLGAAPAFAQSAPETADRTLQQNQRVVLYPRENRPADPALAAPPAAEAARPPAEAARTRHGLALAADQRTARTR